MTKKIFLALAIALSMGLAAQAQKFGIVNAEEIITTMPEFTEVQQKIGESSKQYEDEYGKLQQEMQKKYEEFQNLQKDASTPEGILERRMQDIQQLNQKIEQFAQTAQQDLQRQQMTLMQPVQEKVLNAIRAVGADGNFTMIFPGEVPAYISADVVDVTPLVKTKLGIK